MRGQRSTSSELLSPPQVQPQAQAQAQTQTQGQSPVKMHHIQNIFQTPPLADQNPNMGMGVVLAAPTPVIVRPNRVDRQFRSTVISPNPERAVLSFVERPTAIISTAAVGRCCVPLPLAGGLRRSEGERNQEQPMDFSTSKDAYEEKRSGGAAFSVGLAIAV